jgi:hypothetical protein
VQNDADSIPDRRRCCSKIFGDLAIDGDVVVSANNFSTTEQRWTPHRQTVFLSPIPRRADRAERQGHQTLI